jgi:hypothetical protein
VFGRRAKASLLLGKGERRWRLIHTAGLAGSRQTMRVHELRDTTTLTFPIT